MATKCRILINTFERAKVKTITFSGTVKSNGLGVSRKVKGYKVGFPEVAYETASDVSGNWQLHMRGGSNDKFRIICIGNEGENSEIYEHLTE